ncbi:hypothetical protein ABPG75_010108 [Micractinium tetrahymenae]
MAAASGSLAATLPADLLHRIFCAADPEAAELGLNVDLLSFEERVRAEAVCKHWRAALTSRPAACAFIHLGSELTWQGSEAEAASEKAVRRALAVAARAPLADRIYSDVGDMDSQQLIAAHSAALEALLGCLGPRTLALELPHNCKALPAYLAAAASHTSLARLELNISGDVSLAASPALPGLPHVTELEFTPISGGDSIALSLPMPRLQEANLVADDTEYGPIPLQGVSILAAGPGTGPGGGSSQQALLSSLTRLKVEAHRLELDGAALPALAQLHLDLYFPHGRLVVRNAAALTSLSRLDLRPTTVYDDASLAHMAPWSAVEADTVVRSNRLTPLLTGVSRTLRQLSLNLEEPLNTSMTAAVRGLTNLTRLELKLGGSGPEYDGQYEADIFGFEPACVRLDCRLLAGMAQLRQLALSQDRDLLANALLSRAALRRLPALHTLSLGDPSPLPALAPHLPPSLTRLDLSG